MTEANENRFVYHYVVRTVNGNAETIIDGIAKMTKRIVSQEGCNDLRKEVTKHSPYTNWSFVSLSFLGMEESM